MVLLPLEFSDCYLDSPWFRENVQQYEEELERTNSQIKQLIKDAKSMVNAFKAQEKAMKVFNDRLQKFQFDCIGETLTDDEKLIAGSLKEFGLMLEEVSNEWARTIERAQIQLIKPLEEFRKEHIYSFRDSKKAFDKSSDRYYKTLEHNLSLSHKKKEQQLQDADNDLSYFRNSFHSDSLEYVYKLQEVQERKKFEFVEHLLMFMQVYFNYLHQTHETASDFKDYMKELQMRLVATRDRYDGTKSQTKALMQKMRERPDSSSQTYGQKWSRVGYLFLMEKNTISSRLGSKWTKQFCMYQKENKMFQMVSPSHTSSVVSSSIGSKVTSSNLHTLNNGGIDVLIVKTCTRRFTDSIDKRFCFDLEIQDTNGKIFTLTLQAVSDIDRKKWMAVMDGKEPQYVPSKVFSNKKSAMTLDESGVKFAQKLIEEIERRGVEHQGIYRLVGVTSKVENLLRKGLNPETAPNVDLTDLELWETNTLTSALKSYLRNLPEPLMTFELHRDFIDAAKKDFPADRVTSIVNLVGKLPHLNHMLLSILVKHLGKVQEKHEENKMTVQNLGVCFGPTLMRDNMETVQAIIDIKFSNIIVEILVEERNILFPDQNQNSKAAGDPEEASTPRAHTKLTVRPSLRMKQRPRGMVYDHSPTIGDLDDFEGEQKPKPVRSSRSGAFVSDHTKSNQDGHSLSSHPSSVSDEGLGHISPIGDLEFCLDEMTSESIDPPTFISAPSQSASSPTNQIQDVNEVESSRNDEHQADNSAPRAELSRKTSGSSSKKKASLRKKQPVSSKPTHFAAPINENNNNSSHVSQPVRHPKPKSLRLTNSIKEARKKLSVREGFASPTIKNVRKKILSPVTESRYRASDASDPSSPEAPCDSARRVRTRHIDSISPTRAAGDSDKISSRDDDELLRSSHAPDEDVLKPIVVSSPNEIDDEKKASSDFTKPEVLDLPSSEGETLYVCLAEQSNELSFQPGEKIVNIRESEAGGWVYGCIDGRTGLIPRNYIKFH